LFVLPLLAAACGGEATTFNGVNPTSTSLRDVLLVGNAVSGTISFIDGHTYQNLGSVNILPDLQQRMADINGNLIHAVAYGIIKSHEAIKHFEPANGDRYTDDVFVSPDGSTLYVSRCNLGDVAAFDLTTPDHKELWHTDLDGYKSDHATLSPDGSRIVVSATAVDKAFVLDTKTGAKLASFATGHYPHQNDYSADGKHIYNGSIGDVSLPSLFDFFKGFRLLTVVDAQTYQPVRSYLFSEGIRPSVVTADEKTMYANLSYLNGVIKYDLGSGTIVQTLEVPLSAFAKANYPTKDDYPHD
jgi:DNA-binding beta-propeller fold protein YncE